MFSSTMIPQSVQTEEALGPNDSILDELQLGQRNPPPPLPLPPTADEKDFVAIVPVLPTEMSAAVVPTISSSSSSPPPAPAAAAAPEAMIGAAPSPPPTSSSLPPSSFQKLSSNLVLQSVMVFVFCLGTINSGRRRPAAADFLCAHLSVPMAMHGHIMVHYGAPRCFTLPRGW